MIGGRKSSREKILSDDAACKALLRNLNPIGSFINEIKYLTGVYAKNHQKMITDSESTNSIAYWIAGALK